MIGLNLTPLTRCLDSKLAKLHIVPFRDLLFFTYTMQYETNKLASTWSWMVGKRKQNYYSMHYIQKYKQNLEIEIFGPLVNDTLTHIIRIFVNVYILPSLSTHEEIPEMKTMFNCLSSYSLSFLFTLIL